MNGKLPSKMVNVMPNQNPTSILRQAPGATVAIVAAALLLLSASGTAHAAIQAAAEDDSSWMFSPYTITIVLVLLLVGLVVYKKRGAPGKWEDVSQPVKSPSRAPQEKPQLTNARVPAEPVLFDRRAPVIEGSSQVWERPNPVEVEASVYGAYQIDKEVSKLILGKPHRMDVIASRATDDRRAIEASLVKALESSDTSEDGRRRARLALEEYGFVARQS